MKMVATARIFDFNEDEQLKPDRVKEHFENVFGRELTSDEWAAALMATLAGTGGKKKRAKAMQKALYRAAAVSQEQETPKG